MLSFGTSDYLASSSRDGSESPSLEEEAQSLLSQFLNAPRHPSSSPRPDAAYQERESRTRSKRTANGGFKAVKNQEMKYKQGNKGSSHVSLPRRPSLRASTTWQQNVNNNIITPSTKRDKPTRTIPPRSKTKVSVNRTSMNRQGKSPDDYSLTDSSCHILSDVDNPTLSTKKKGQSLKILDQSLSSLKRESSTKSTAANKPKRLSSQRPRRSVAVPTNYFGKYPGFGGIEDSIFEPRSQRESPGESERSTSPVSERSGSIDRQYHIQHPISRIRRAVVSSSARLDSDEMSVLLHGREVGCHVNHMIRSNTSFDRLRHVKSWKGASNDVIVLTWSEDGTRFAVGAAAQCDEHNMQYNRGNNLVLGDLVSNSLKALPDHRIPRPLPTSPTSENVYNTVDPHLYMSITAVQWYGDTLFTASYDNTVKLWDVSSHSGAHCLRTLHHRSKVQVMARSNFSRNLLATGAQSFGVWNLDGGTYIPLDIVRRNHTKDLELIPSSLAWGTINATKDILVGGMSGKDPENGDMSREGHMAVWRVSESSINCEQLLPNAQNVFDITWHPSLPLFATGSAAPLMRSSTTAKDTRSVIRVYDPLTLRRCALEYDCPALDINDVKFCPMDTNYITASCTDGVTYVWDSRKPSEILHRLEHGEPLNQLDENLTREQADVGVRVALWSDNIHRFYTGGSDGRLKAWDILRSPDDAHIQDIVSLKEEIMCAAFSGDKTNLLIGDAAGGIHVLSSGPFEHTDMMKFEHSGESSETTEDDSESASASASAAKMADKLLLSGQLVRHPVYGVGQGPYYNGPYAAWARPPETPSHLLAITPLIEEIQALQLDGPPVERRRNLDLQSQQYVAAQIKLAHIRNQKRSAHKRKRHEQPVWPVRMAITPENFINLCSDEEDMNAQLSKHSRHSKRGKSEPVITQMGSMVIDLTEDTDSEEVAIENELPIQEANAVDGKDTGSEQLLDALEEDYWWPDSGVVDANLQDLDD